MNILDMPPPLWKFMKNDGGQNWTKQNSQQINADGEICFVNEQEGYSTNQGEIYISKNQEKFCALDYKKVGISFKKMIVTPDHKVVAIGYNGTVLIK